jgi:hypothetical protein
VGTVPERVGLERDLQNKKAGGKLCVGNGPAPIPLDESGRPLENKPIMTYRTCQNIVLIGSFFLLLDILFLPPLVEKWGAVDRVDRLPQLNTPTVAAATIVKVWAYKKTGLYYCPDSKLYGKIKPGVYMTQEKALERGYRPAGQDPCR